MYLPGSDHLWLVEISQGERTERGEEGPGRHSQVKNTQISAKKTKRGQVERRPREERVFDYSSSCVTCSEFNWGT